MFQGKKTHPLEKEKMAALKAKWKKEIDAKLGGTEDAVDSCIYKVPSKLRKVKEDAYNPRVVSIGPFHRGNPDLVDSMREHKWRYMLNFLEQTDVREESQRCFNSCADAVYELEEEVRQSYSETIKFDKNELAKIMLLDGCFVLELFLRSYAKNVEKVDGPDPVLKSAWMEAALQHDLALLENQIPFLILERLYGIVKPNATISVASLALKFFKPISRKQIPDNLGIDCKHLLDLLHKFYFLTAAGSGSSEEAKHINMEMISSINGHNAAAVEQSSSCLFFCKVCQKGKQKTFSYFPHAADPASNNKWGFNYCAWELLQSGVQFHTSSHKDDQLLNIEFDKEKGVLSIPQLIINEETSSLLRNLIAFEQYSLNSTQDVTAYAFLMQSLIGSPADTRLLKEKGIIVHNHIRDREYLSQFKGIVEEVVAKDDFFFADLRDQVNKYCKFGCSLNKLRAILKVRFVKDISLLSSTYFASEWSFISFLAASALLVLTSLQTYYAIHPRH